MSGVVSHIGPVPQGFEIKNVTMIIEGREYLIVHGRTILKQIFKVEDTLIRCPRGTVELPLIDFSCNLPHGIPPTYNETVSGVSAVIRYTVTTKVTLDKVFGKLSAAIPNENRTLEFIVDNDASCAVPRWTPKSYIVDHVFAGGDKRASRLFNCCVPTSKSGFSVQCTLDKEYYRGARTMAMSFSLKSDVKAYKAKASIVRCIHFKSDKKREGIVDIEILGEMTSLGSNQFSFLFPEQLDPLPWTIGTLFRSMYYVKLELLTEREPYTLLVPLFLMKVKPLQYRFSSSEGLFPLRTNEYVLYDRFAQPLQHTLRLPGFATPNYKYICELGNVNGELIDRLGFNGRSAASPATKGWSSTAAEDAAYNFSHISTIS